MDESVALPRTQTESHVEYSQERCAVAESAHCCVITLCVVVRVCSGLLAGHSTEVRRRYLHVLACLVIGLGRDDVGGTDAGSHQTTVMQQGLVQLHTHTNTQHTSQGWM